tara:strand:- start:556 stop:672 length:117 start_codon:yes stop_codon:yes gene_type:complete
MLKSSRRPVVEAVLAGQDALAVLAIKSRKTLFIKFTAQ